MKIAFVHDWLVFPGGAEKVFFDLINSTLDKNYNKHNSKFAEYLEQNGVYKQKNEYKIFTNFLSDDFPNNTDIEIESVFKGKYIKKIFRNLMPIFPIIAKKLSKNIEKYNPDLIIISSFALAKNIDVKAKKLIYIHSVMQYIWTHYDEYVNKFSGIKKIVFKLSAHYLRKWDKKYYKFDKIFFNSNYTKKNFEKIYKISSSDDVLFPIVEKPKYKDIDIHKKYNLDKEYYIFIGRVVRLVKNLDLLIKIFNQTNKTLVIVGDGPDKDYLQSIANKNIKFLGYLNNKSDEYWNLLEKAKASINLTEESFGITNYQAYLTNTPLISINKGAIHDIPGKKILINNFDELLYIINR